MLVKLGEDGMKTVEDLADCATDDLVGWTERKMARRIKHTGFLDGFDISREEAETHDHAGAREGRLDQEADLAQPARRKLQPRRKTSGGLRQAS